MPTRPTITPPDPTLPYQHLVGRRVRVIGGCDRVVPQFHHEAGVVERMGVSMGDVVAIVRFDRPVTLPQGTAVKMLGLRSETIEDAPETSEPCPCWKCLPPIQGPPTRAVAEQVTLPGVLPSLLWE